MGIYSLVKFKEKEEVRNEMKISELNCSSNPRQVVTDFLKKSGPDDVFTTAELVKKLNLRTKDCIRVTGCPYIKLSTEEGIKSFYGSAKALKKLEVKYGGKIIK